MFCLRVTESIFDAAIAPDVQPVKGMEENTTRRCGDFPECAIYPLPAAEVRKYLCINKWGSNPAEYIGASTVSAVYSRLQWNMEYRQDSGKGSLHSRTGADDVVDKDRLETAWQS